MSWQQEFPTYTNMPPIPKGWSDQSWGADTCPCFEVRKGDAGLYMVWVDFEHEHQREHKGLKRFSVGTWTGNAGEGDVLLETDSWDEVLKFMGEKP